MEHRWGDRLAVDLCVSLRSPVQGHVMGRLRSLSISGALIFIDPARAPRGWLEVLIAGDRVPAVVVRATYDAIGVEWCELAPPVVCALLDGVRPAQRYATT